MYDIVCGHINGAGEAGDATYIFRLRKPLSSNYCTL